MLASTRTNAEQSKNVADQTSIAAALEDSADVAAELLPNNSEEGQPESAPSESLPLDPEKRKEHLDRIEQVERSRKKRRRKKIMRRLMWCVVFMLIAALVAVAVSFVTFRWYTFDDAADMIGTWRLEGTGMQVEISDTTIRLNEDVAYKYSINPTDKTISFKFGNMTGQGRYRFSLDRQQLSITDGEFSFWGTLLDDIPWTLAALFSEWFGMGQLTPGVGDGVTALTKQLSASAGAGESGAALDALPEGQNAEQGEGGTAGDAEGAAGAGDAGGAGASGDQAKASSSSSSSASDVRDVDALDLPTDVGA